MFMKLFNISRLNKIVLLILLDSLLLPFSLWCAVYLRLGGSWPFALRQSLWIFALPALGVLPVFIHLGLYRAVIRFLNDKVLVTVFYGVTSAMVLQAAVLEIAGITAFPRSALLIFWVFAMAYVGGSRFLLRALLRRFHGAHTGLQPVAIYGAGSAGLELMQALQSSDTYRVVALFDDDPALWGLRYGNQVVLPPARVADEMCAHGSRELLLAMPSASRQRHQQVLLALEPLRLHIRRVPLLETLLSGGGRVDELEPVDVDDLLGRDPVPPRAELLQRNIEGQVVMVTGAGGSIGCELCRWIVKNRPSRLVLFDLSEFALYAIDQELGSSAPHIARVAVLGSVLDGACVRRVIQSFGVQTIYHAAAYKHVPMVECNPVAGIQNNTLGTAVCADVAQECGVESFVLVSTDKAVRPTSVMGASKRLAELCLQARHPAHGRSTRFVIVRFGNVLGSSGSVVPLFQQQIRQGGPLTVTHQDMTRYFMTIPEAAQLVIQAGAMGQGGDVFVLDMGEPVKIADLARRIVHLSGLEVRDDMHPDGDIGIRFDGLRPGEKLYEELLIGGDVLPTEHARILRAQEHCLGRKELDHYLTELREACGTENAARALSILKQAVREYQSAGKTPEDQCA